MNTTSQKQIIANRVNAKKGGVKTDIGKKKVRYNARKHGILCNVLTEYEGPVFDAFLDSLYEEFQPQTFSEEIVIERIAINNYASSDLSRF